MPVFFSDALRRYQSSNCNLNHNGLQRFNNDFIMFLMRLGLSSDVNIHKRSSIMAFLLISRLGPVSHQTSFATPKGGGKENKLNPCFKQSKLI